MYPFFYQCNYFKIKKLKVIIALTLFYTLMQNKIIALKI